MTSKSAVMAFVCLVASWGAQAAGEGYRMLWAVAT